MVGQRPGEIPFCRTVSQANPDLLPFCVAEFPVKASWSTKPVFGVTKGRLLTPIRFTKASHDLVRFTKASHDPVPRDGREP